MSRTSKATKPRILTPNESSYTMMPWACNHYPDYSEIEAYVPITGNHEIIADIHDTHGVDAEVVAGLITRAVNSYEKHRDMIEQMIAALELCMTCAECLTWEAEHDAQAVLKRATELEKGRG